MHLFETYILSLYNVSGISFLENRIFLPVQILIMSFNIIYVAYF